MSSTRLRVLVVTLSIIVIGCTTDDAETPPSHPGEATTATPATSTTGVPAPTTTAVISTTTTTAAPATTTAAQLDALVGIPFDEFLDESFEILLLRRPQFLTSLGVAEQFGLRNDVLDDLSPEFLAETQALEAGILDALRTHDRAALADAQRVSFDVAEWYLDQRVRGHRFAYHEYPVHHFVNSYNFNLILFLSEEHPLGSPADAEDFIARLSLIDDQVAQMLERLRISESRGVVPTRFLVDWTIHTLREDLGGAASPESVRITSLPLYRAFADRIASVAAIDEDTRAGLLDRVETELAESFVPAWEALIGHMEQIKPQASPDDGLWRLPDGQEYYAWLLRDHTSTDLTPDEVHEMGLREVARVEEELRAAFTALGYPEDDSINALRERARSDAGYLGGSTATAEVVAAYEELIADAEEAARPFFGVWPQARVRVVADAGGGGYYVAGSVDGSREGAFHAGVGGNVSLLTMPTITYHEAVPGHHTQIAIAQELDLPGFRRFIQYNAFAEGWALYAERLAAEMGLYDDDPYGNIGRLELELLRAVRLVVDTGIHALGWTREEAHAYMDETIAGWGPEVERYMVLPGQATGYMIGMRTIMGLRDEAAGVEELAAFHDLILGGGSMPLGILEAIVTASEGE